MHGTGPDGNGNEGGFGGEYVEISANSIHGEQRYGLPGFRKTRAAFDLRGRAQERVLFIDNVLSHDDRGEAVRESWRQAECWNSLTGSNRSSDECASVVRFEGNAFGALSDRIRSGDVTGRADHGILDFDGDGVADSFFPTGAAWYYRSGQETEWRFLNHSRIKLDGILALTDYDGDGKTDVLRLADGRRMISRGGTDRWEILPRPSPDTEPVSDGHCNENSLGEACGGQEGAKCRLSFAGRPECVIPIGFAGGACRNEADCSAGHACIPNSALGPEYGNCMRRIPTHVVQ